MPVVGAIWRVIPVSSLEMWFCFVIIIKRSSNDAETGEGQIWRVGGERKK